MTRSRCGSRFVFDADLLSEDNRGSRSSTVHRARLEAAASRRRRRRAGMNVASPTAWCTQNPRALSRRLLLHRPQPAGRDRRRHAPRAARCSSAPSEFVAAHRVRERRQPAARARQRAAEGGRAFARALARAKRSQDRRPAAHASAVARRVRRRRRMLIVAVWGVDLARHPGAERHPAADARSRSTPAWSAFTAIVCSPTESAVRTRAGAADVAHRPRATR